MERELVDTAVRFQRNMVLGAEPGTWFFLALLFSVLFLVWQYRRFRTVESPLARWALMGTRLLLLAGVLLFLLKPTVLKQRLAVLKPTLPILVDISRSMSLPYGREGEATRLDTARDLVRGLMAREGSEAVDVQLFTFDEEVRPVSPDELDAVEARGGRSDILGAMSMVHREGGRSPSGILVLTDGRQSGEASGYPSPGKWVLVGIGSREPFRDLRLSDMRIPDIGFKKKPMTVTAEVESRGYESPAASVSLKVDGKLVTVKKVNIPADGTAEVEFEWTPEETGSYRVAVEMPTLSDEGVMDNNRRESLVTVVRDRLRVLFIAGAPSWNYRFLREALKSDPSLDLISFIILRSPYDVVDVPQNELALIPFPTKKLFTEELDSFDLVIMDNFSFRPYLPTAYLARLRDRVKAGGGLWMLGGPMAFLGGGYRNSPVEEVLPFSLKVPPGGGGYLQQPFEARFSPESFDGPFFNFDETLIGGRDAVSRLPALSGFNPVGPAREGATVLVEHPHHLVEGKPQPIVALHRYGQGRVMAVATDYLWTWNFVASGAGLGNRMYLEFVNNTVRWLTHDPQLSPVKLSVFPEEASAGEVVRVQVAVRDEHYRPVKDPSLGLTVQGPDGRKTLLQAKPSREDGLYEAEYLIPREGSYRFQMEAVGPRGSLGEAVSLFQADPRDQEMSSPGLDEEFLGALARENGGLYIPFGEGEDFTDRLAGELKPGGERYRLLSEERIGLGSLPLTFLLFLTALGADWAIRKRYHLE